MSQSPQSGAMVRTIEVQLDCLVKLGLNPLKAGQWFGPHVAEAVAEALDLVSIPSKRGNGSDARQSSGPLCPIFVSIPSKRGNGSDQKWIHN